MIKVFCIVDTIDDSLATLEQMEMIHTYLNEKGIENSGYVPNEYSSDRNEILKRSCIELHLDIGVKTEKQLAIEKIGHFLKDGRISLANKAFTELFLKEVKKYGYE